MDFLSNLTKTDETKPTKPDDHQKPSTTDLFSSAKVVAEAAQSHLRHEPATYDKGKVASATADLLDCANKYGKLDANEGVGKYVGQAEDYLRQFGSTTTTAAAVVDSGEHKAAAVATSTTVTTEPEKVPSAGGAEDCAKIAEGFLNKPSGGGEGGAGDVMKLAGDWLKK